MNNTIHIHLKSQIKKAMKTLYWSGGAWKPLEESKSENIITDHWNYSTVDMARNTCAVCSYHGYHLCRCPHTSNTSQDNFKQYPGSGLYTLQKPYYLAQNVRWPHFDYGMPSDKVKLDEIVDHCLLPVEIEIEASL